VLAGQITTELQSEYESKKKMVVQGTMIQWDLKYLETFTGVARPLRGHLVSTLAS
jgi:hypothetical protein